MKIRYAHTTLKIHAVYRKSVGHNPLHTVDQFSGNQPWVCQISVNRCHITIIFRQQQQARAITMFTCFKILSFPGNMGHKSNERDAWNVISERSLNQWLLMEIARCKEKTD